MTDKSLIDINLNKDTLETKQIESIIAPAVVSSVRANKMTAEAKRESNRSSKAKQYYKDKEFAQLITKFFHELSMENLKTTTGLVRIKNNTYRINYQIKCKKVRQLKK